MPPGSTLASLTVPLTQNTAEVREYRCMFTHDVRRKNKRYNDGTLTYHAFNNRIIVFDDAKNRVGDAYWNKAFAFCEGEELQLQQGILVEVQDELGRKEQDVSGVIATRDTNKTSQAASTRPSPWKAVTTVGPSGSGPQNHRIGISTSQGKRPKSLKEVLKTPQGSMLGRARMPESPYEQRYGGSPVRPGREPVVLCGMPEPLAFTAPEESPRPKKRPRLGEAAVHKALTPTASVVQDQNKTKPRTLRAAPTPPVNHASDPIIIESDEETLTLTPEQPTPVTCPTSRSGLLRESDSSTAPAIARQTLKSTSNARTRPQAQEQGITRNAAPSTEGAAESCRPASNILRERPVNTLKPASGQPRRKLMYRDLLPSNFAFKNTKSQNMPTNPTKHSAIAAMEPSGTSKRAPIGGPTGEQPSKLTRSRGQSAVSRSTIAPEDTSRLPVNPVTPVVPEENADPPTEGSLPDSDSFFMMDDTPTLAELDQALVASKQQQALRSALNRKQRPQPGPRTSQTVDEIRATTAAVAGLQASRQTPRKGTLQRVLTEPAPQSPDPASRRRSPLKKTISDTTGEKARPPEPVVAEDRDADRGPWSREAFDLFGWRPGDTKELITKVALR